MAKALKTIKIFAKMLSAIRANIAFPTVSFRLKFVPESV